MENEQKQRGGSSGDRPGHTTQPDGAAPESTSRPDDLPALVAAHVVRLVGDVGGSLHPLEGNASSQPRAAKKALDSKMISIESTLRECDWTAIVYVPWCCLSGVSDQLHVSEPRISIRSVSQQLTSDP